VWRENPRQILDVKGAAMRIKATAAAVKKLRLIIGIKRELGDLQPIVDEITAEPRFLSPERDAFVDYVRDKYLNSDMDRRQMKSVLIAVARRFYSRR
jgi:hypothetical protein